MIQSFRCSDTKALFEGRSPRQFRAFKDAAIRKLTYLEAAAELRDLKAPPGNRLEKLKGARAGQYSLRASTISGVYASNGRAAARPTWKLSTITRKHGDDQTR